MWQSKIYTFKDIQEKRSYIFDRVKKIYEQISDDDINNLLDDIKIRLREQKEKGASIIL
jgi:hemerythrin superfamily protein